LLLLPLPLLQQLINSLVNCHVKRISHGGISIGGRRISEANGGRKNKNKCSSKDGGSDADTNAALIGQ
jgi:hypothetical protein